MSRVYAWSIVKLFFQVILVVFVSALLVFLVGDFADRLNAYLDKASSDIVALYFNKMLGAIAQLAPAVILLSASLTCSIIRKRGELTALRSLGMSPTAVLIPVLSSCLMLALGLMFFDNNIATHAGVKVDRMMVEKFDRWGDFRLFYTPQSWFRMGAHVFYVRNRESKTLVDVTVLRLDESFRVSERYDAKTMTSAGGDMWTLQPFNHRLFRDNEQITFENIQTQVVHFENTAPDSFDVIPGRPELMSFSELAQQLTIRQRVGLSQARIYLAAHNRIATPLLGVLGAFVACLLALRPNRKGHLTMSLIEGTGVIVCLFLFSFVGRALAISERIDVAFAVWSPVVLVLCGALVLQRRFESA
jgi:lipopolysaccharide export system permease protein